MSEKSPAFQLYAKDLLTDDKFNSLTDEECGVFLRLLCFDWINDGIPFDVESIARLLRKPLREMKRCWINVGACFMPHPSRHGRLTNPRLESERAKQEAYRVKQMDNGKKGGRPRKEKPEDAKTETQNKPKENPTLIDGITQTKTKKSSSSSNYVNSDTDVSGENARKEKLNGPFEVAETVLKAVHSALEWTEPTRADVIKNIKPDSAIQVLVKESSVEEAVKMFCFAHAHWTSPPTWSSVFTQRNQLRDQMTGRISNHKQIANGKDTRAERMRAGSMFAISETQ